MQKEIKHIIRSYRDKDVMTERNLAEDLIVYINQKRKKWMIACLVMTVSEIITVILFMR